MDRWMVNGTVKDAPVLIYVLPPRFSGSGDDSGPGRLSRRLSRLGSRHQRHPPQAAAPPDRPAQGLYRRIIQWKESVHTTRGLHATEL